MPEILWWHWIVLGIVLMLARARGAGVLPDLVRRGGRRQSALQWSRFPRFPFAWQIVAWTAGSLALRLALVQDIQAGHATRPASACPRARRSARSALVIRDIRPYDRGQIRFQKPMLGDDVWESIADEEIKVGERVKVLDVEGNILKVGESSEGRWPMGASKSSSSRY